MISTPKGPPIDLRFTLKGQAALASTTLTNTNYSTQSSHATATPLSRMLFFFVLLLQQLYPESELFLAVFLCHQDPLLYHLTNFAAIDPYFSLMKNGSRGSAEQGNETIMNTGLQNLSQLGNVSDHTFGLDHERGCMVSHAAVPDLGSHHPCLLVIGAFGAHVSAM